MGARRAVAKRWLVAVALLVAKGAVARAEEHGLAARVNGRPVSRERLERYFEDYALEKRRNIAGIRSPEALKQLKREALDGLIEQELLWQETERRKVAASQQEVDAAMATLRSQFRSPEALRRRLERGGFTEQTYAEWVKRQLSIRQLVERDIISKVTVPDEEVHALYESRPDLFSHPERVRVRHILVKVEPGAAAGVRSKARKAAESILARARRKGADFAELARKHSQDATAPNGGDLGFITRGQMVAPFEEAAFGLKAGEISGLVETVFGYHVIKVEERRAEERIPEEEAREPIRQRLRAEKAETALREKVKTLRASGKIEILVPL
jgi:peptidyl-prolyl cis-trans isomerase C